MINFTLGCRKFAWRHHIMIRWTSLVKFLIKLTKCGIICRETRKRSIRMSFRALINSIKRSNFSSRNRILLTIKIIMKRDSSMREFFTRYDSRRTSLKQWAKGRQHSYLITLVTSAGFIKPLTSSCSYLASILLPSFLSRVFQRSCLLGERRLQNSSVTKRILGFLTPYPLIFVISQLR